MKTKSRSLLAFEDCSQVLDMALKVPDLIVKFPTVAAANSFRQRCYKLMRVLREMQAELVGHIPGRPIEISYDVIQICFIDRAEGRKQSETLQFRRHSMRFELFDPETGDQVSLEEEKSPEQTKPSLF